IEEYLVVKVGGHGDQLSNSIMGLDRFRIRALEKLILKGRLRKEQQEAAFEELSRKCRIYGHGCIKRGKKSEGEDYLGLPDRIMKRVQEANAQGKELRLCRDKGTGGRGNEGTGVVGGSRKA
ncbi:MAG: hypothetical protein JRJ51_15795, partial [Deltaproteobacteria bacterium]|nr:hypothetical protein [Deltaproteobacteria bacterium]